MATKTLEQILDEEAADHRAYEARTVAARLNGQEYTIADLRLVFDKIKSPDGWKEPWAAAVPHQLVPLVLEAARFFHGDLARVVGVEPLTGKVLMEGRGYQC